MKVKRVNKIFVPIIRFYLESTFNTNRELIFIGFSKLLITLIFTHSNKQFKDHFLFLNSFTKLVFEKSAKICKPDYEKKKKGILNFIFPPPKSAIVAI